MLTAMVKCGFQPTCSAGGASADCSSSVSSGSREPGGSARASSLTKAFAAAASAAATSPAGGSLGCSAPAKAQGEFSHGALGVWLKQR